MRLLSPLLLGAAASFPLSGQAADQTVAPLVVNSAAPAGLQVTTAVADGTNVNTIARFGPTSGQGSYNDTEQRVVVYGSGDNTNGRAALVLQQNGTGGVRSAVVTQNGVNTSRIPTNNGGIVGSMQVFADAAVPLQLGTSYVARMTIDSVGNVGIGSTPVAGQGQLQLQPGSGDVVVRLNGGKTSTGEGSAFVCGQGGGYNQAFGNWSGVIGGAFDNTGILFSATAWKFTTGGSTARMTIDSTGNVGIGAAPSAGLGLLQLASGTTKASGISAGNDTFLFREAAGSWLAQSSSGAAQIAAVDSTGVSKLAIYADVGSGILSQVGNKPLSFRTNNTTAVIIDAQQNVGVGGAPGQKFDVIGATNANVVSRVLGQGTGLPFIQLGAASGTAEIMASPNGDFIVNANNVASNIFTVFRAGAVPNTLVVQNGKVGIGMLPSTSALAVNGVISAKEIKVVANPADYVFAAGYRLRPLAEVEAFITAHKHLPGLPSAKEQEEQGEMVADLMRAHLEKIEELNLYVIQQQKVIDALVAQQKAAAETMQRQDAALAQVLGKLAAIEAGHASAVPNSP